MQCAAVNTDTTGSSVADCGNGAGRCKHTRIVTAKSPLSSACGLGGGAANHLVGVERQQIVGPLQLYTDSDREVTAEFCL